MVREGRKEGRREGENTDYVILQHFGQKELNKI